MSILVTGGAGYIGSHVVYQLIDRGYDVVIIDDLSTGNEQAIHPQAKFYRGDQRDEALLNLIFKQHKIEAVMHFSAKLIVPESVAKPIFYFENNVNGVASLLKSMRKYKVNNFIFSSTAAIYGNPLTPEPILETALPNPVSPYGQSKLACEWLIEAETNVRAFNYVILRYFNVAGARADGTIGLAPNKGKKLTHLVPTVVETALGQRKIMTIFGDDYPTKDGTGVRDYIHVEDLATAHIKGLEYALSNQSGIFNLGSGVGFSVKQVIKSVEKNMKLKVNYFTGPKRPGDSALIVANTNKAASILNFHVTRDLDKIIIDDVN